MATPDLIGTCLWFEGRAVEAAEFYVSLFPDSRIVHVSTVGAGPAKGNAFVVFELAGRTFQGIDGGPMFKFTPAVSFVVNCESQEEIDRYWEALSDGGREGVLRLAGRPLRRVLAGDPRGDGRVDERRLPGG